MYTFTPSDQCYHSFLEILLNSTPHLTALHCIAALPPTLSWVFDTCSYFVTGSEACSRKVPSSIWPPSAALFSQVRSHKVLQCGSVVPLHCGVQCKTLWNGGVQCSDFINTDSSAATARRNWIASSMAQRLQMIKVVFMNIMSAH